MSAAHLDVEDDRLAVLRSQSIDADHVSMPQRANVDDVHVHEVCQEADPGM